MPRLSSASSAYLENTPPPLVAATSTHLTGLITPKSLGPINLREADSAAAAMPPKARTDSPARASPRRQTASTATTTVPRQTLPTPLSNSPSLPSLSLPASSSTTGGTTSHHASGHRLPPAFITDPPPQQHRSRYSASSHTPFSPYRPGEYGRSERGIASERTRIATKVERRLFPEDKSKSGRDGSGGEELGVPKRDKEGMQGSSPLGSAFEAKMVLRNGASIDLISWLRTNFHHIPLHQHNSMTPQMSLIGIRALLLERFPRVPDLSELSKAVLAAFPHSQWDVSKGAFGHAEPPTVRGLVWHGKDVADESDADGESEEERERERERQHRQRQSLREGRRGTMMTRARAASGYGKIKADGSNSPPQSTLVSPISSSRRVVPDTPARSVLEEFAEIATLADKTPGSKAKSLPGEAPLIAPSPAFALATICNSFDATEPVTRTEPLFHANPNLARKRRASESPEPMRRRSSTPDKLHGLLIAAEAVEGSSITSVLGHKRRRTIGGPGTMRDVLHPVMSRHTKRAFSRGTVSPRLGGRSFLPDVQEVTPMDVETEGEHVADLLVPLNDTASAVSLTDLETVSLAAQSRPNARDHTSSTASQTSIASNVSNFISEPAPGLAGPSSVAAQPAKASAVSSRRANELPTQGDHPGVDCKPPYPYHEMIRHAIEEAPDRRLQLSQIYSSIADRFPFFKTLDEKKTAGWQNSIRHNLSLKKMFVRVNKVDGIPDDNGGKGGWWTVQMGVFDEGRPGRKAKGKKRNSGDAVENLVGGEGQGERESTSAELYHSETRAEDRVYQRDEKLAAPAIAVGDSYPNGKIGEYREFAQTNRLVQ